MTKISAALTTAFFATSSLTNAQIPQEMDSEKAYWALYEGPVVSVESCVIDKQNHANTDGSATTLQDCLLSPLRTEGMKPGELKISHGTAALNTDSTKIHFTCEAKRNREGSVTTTRCQINPPLMS